MARFLIDIDLFAKKVSAKIEIDDEEHEAIFLEAKRRGAGFLAEVFQALPIEINIVPSPDRSDDTNDTPLEEP